MNLEPSNDTEANVDPSPDQKESPRVEGEVANLAEGTLPAVPMSDEDRNTLFYDSLREFKECSEVVEYKLKKAIEGTSPDLRSDLVRYWEYSVQHILFAASLYEDEWSPSTPEEAERHNQRTAVCDEIEKELDTYPAKLRTMAATPQEEALTKQVHGVIAKMLKRLDFHINPTDFPIVSYGLGGGDSQFNRFFNYIELNGRGVTSGYTMGEEIAHWLRHQRSKDAPKYTDAQITRRDITSEQREQAGEFLGFIGRELARRACCDTSELIGLFDDKVKGRPERVEDLQWDLSDVLCVRASPDDFEKRWPSTMRACMAPIKKAVLRMTELTSFDPDHDEGCPTIWLQEVEKNLTAFEEYLNGHFLEPFNEWNSNASGAEWFEDAKKYDSKFKEVLKDLKLKIAEANQAYANRAAEKGDLPSPLPELAAGLLRLRVRADVYYDDIAHNFHKLCKHYQSLLDHRDGYIAAAVWLEQNRDRDIFEEARKMFEMSDEDLYHTYVAKLVRCADDPPRSERG